MSPANEQQEKIDKYRQFFGISVVADLSALKERYALLSDKFETQGRSADENVRQNGYENMQVLDQAFAALADDIRSREFSGQEEQGEQMMNVEVASMRVGFQILEGGSKFFVRETRRVALFGSTKTNNILSSSWPAGKLTLYTDYLELSCLLGSHEVSFSDIAVIERAWYIPLWLRVKQKNKEAESVHIFGWGLVGKLKDAIQKNRLPLKMDLDF